MRSAASRRVRARLVHRDHGPVGLRQVDAHAHPRRPRPATGGWVEIDGVRLDALVDRELTLLRRRVVGFIFQTFNLLPVLNAEENIALPLRIGGDEPDRAWMEHAGRRASGSATGSSTARLSCPAASSSGWRSPAR